MIGTIIIFSVSDENMIEPIVIITQVNIVVINEFFAFEITFLRMFNRANAYNSPHKSVSPVVHSSG